MNDKKNTQELVKYPKFRWLMLASAVLAMFCAQMATMSFAPIMGVISKDLNISLGTASFGFMGMNLFSTAVGVIIAGMLIDRIGSGRVMSGGIILILLANSAIPLVGHSYIALVIIRMLEALGLAPALIAIQPVVSFWFPENERGLAFGLNAFCVFGPVLSLMFGPGIILSASTWQNGMLYYSIVFAIAAIFIAGVAVAAKNHLPPTLANNSSKENNQEIAKPNFKIVLRHPAFWLGLIVMALANWSTQAFNDLSPAYLAVDPPVGVGYGAQTAGSFSALTWIGMICGMFLSGIIIDKIFKGKPAPVLLIGFLANLVFMTGILLQPIYSSGSTLTAWLMIAGFFNPFVSVGNQIYSVRVFAPNVIGKVSAIWTCVGNFAGSIGVMAGSFALHLTGTYKMSFIIIGIVCAIGLVASLLSSGKQDRIDTESSAAF
jgi:MFS family permease